MKFNQKKNKNGCVNIYMKFMPVDAICCAWGLTTDCITGNATETSS